LASAHRRRRISPSILIQARLAQDTAPGSARQVIAGFAGNRHGSWSLWMLELAVAPASPDLHPTSSPQPSKRVPDLQHRPNMRSRSYDSITRRSLAPAAGLTPHIPARAHAGGPMTEFVSRPGDHSADWRAPSRDR
jgi:hypothetical protein